jgi:hypothetical protein
VIQSPIQTPKNWVRLMMALKLEGELLSFVSELIVRETADELYKENDCEASAHTARHRK